MHDARRGRRWTEALEPFAIAEVPITAQQYASITGADAASAATTMANAVEQNATVPNGSAPAVNVTWLDAVRFCNAASLQAGFSPAYELHESGIVWNVQANGYRLPTEAEWEYACRTHTIGPHYAPLGEAAWTALDGLEQPQPVGLRTPNAFGLYDMLGNAWEWCWDFLDPARYGDYRVFRGGGFADPAWSVRASTRRGGAPDMSHTDLGFRVARGGFTDREVVQGWSAQADAARGAAAGALPVGWTPRDRP
nr:SUMF1/EgtB/PvdO family nonheme iron enzyme [Leucobacter exalbidus]